jgi:molybdopterin/thiamine biosynthesis adenylyltransferase
MEVFSFPHFFSLFFPEKQKMVPTRDGVAMKTAVREIDRASREVTAPDGSSVRVLSLEKTKEVAGRFDLTQKEVEIEALSKKIIPDRYLRNCGTLGTDGQIALLASRVAVVGIGGLGGTVARSLARAGVGTLVLIDGDLFSEDNLNRQEFSLESVIGIPKVAAAAEEIRKINSSVTAYVFNERVDEARLREILGGTSVVVDALDSLSGRFALERAARSLRIPIVHGAVAGFVGQMATIFPDDKGYDTIYGPPEELPERGAEVVLGNLSGVVGTVAAIQSMEVVKLVTGIGTLLRGKLLFIDLEHMTFELFSL